MKTRLYPIPRTNYDESMLRRMSFFSFLSFQSMAMESQESIFGPENIAPPAQSNIQPQLQEQETKLDDSIDNQQQARTNIAFIDKLSLTLCLLIFYLC